MFRGGNSRYRNNRGGAGGSSRKQTSQQKGLFADGIWHCNCTPRLPAEHFRVKKQGPNQGRWFYTCQQADPKRCDLFLWDEDAKPREEAAVLSGKRSEPGVQDGWTAGRSRDAGSGSSDAVFGKGLFTWKPEGAVRRQDDDSTASPSPPPAYSSVPPVASASKRTAIDADLDDEFDYGLSGEEEDALANAMDSAVAPETPYKAQKTGVYATPATTAKRKLPWLEEPTTPAARKPAGDYFETPSKAPLHSVPLIQAETPRVPPTVATAASPSPPTRHKDALANPADSSSSLTSEVLSTLSSVKVPPDILSNIRSILTKHDLKTQGIVKGRDISRLAIKAKDAKIAELQARTASLEADREVERSISRMRRRDVSGHG